MDCPNCNRPYSAEELEVGWAETGHCMICKDLDLLMLTTLAEWQEASEAWDNMDSGERAMLQAWDCYEEMGWYETGVDL